MTVAATLTLDEAARTAWDVVVVGAGPAGALAARETAQRGPRVLLVDRATFPRWKVCGCCLNAAALSTLSSVGLGELAARRGAVPLTEVRLAAPRRRAALPLPGGVALSREAFDAALVESAVASGAAFLPGTAAALGDVRVSSGRPSPPAPLPRSGGEGRLLEQTHSAGGRRLILRQGTKQAEVRARLVLAADGLGGALLAREPGFEAVPVAGSRIGAGAVAPSAPACYGQGTIHMACGTAGYVGLVRLEDGRLDLAAAFDRAAVRRLGSPASAAAAILAEVSWPAVPGLERLAWRGTAGLTRRASRLAGERVFVLGDAAGYVEPFTGEGMAWALAAAVAVAPLAVEAARQWRPGLEQEWAAVYRQVVLRRQHTCRLAARVLRHAGLARAVVGLLAAWPHLARPVLRRLNASPLPKAMPS